MTEKELLEVIDRAYREEWTELDLSDRELKHLPSKMVKLKNLNSLDISFNKLAELRMNLRNINLLMSKARYTIRWAKN